MPHVEVKCFPGRTEEQKKLLADKIANDVAEIFKTKLSSVSVTIKDISEDEWKEKVWDLNIVPDEKFMFKKPGYTCE